MMDLVKSAVSLASVAVLAHVVWRSGALEDKSRLHRAVESRNPVLVGACLAAGEPVDKGLELGPLGVLASQTPLHAACANGDVASVALLLAARADVDAGLTVGPLGLVLSETPLYAAAERGHALTVQALLAAGAQPRRGVSVFGVLNTTPREAAERRGYRATFIQLP